MDNFKSFKCILTICLILNFTQISFSQNNFYVNGDIFGRRTFIKNNGQFDKILPNNSQVDYAYVNGNEQVYFNKNGLTYFLQKRKPLTHSQHEAIEHGKKVVEKPAKKAFVNVNWINSNPNAEIVVSEKQTYYHSFGDEKYKSECYKKITYKNIYNKIDIEYLFTNERENGIKYNIILHPGANVNDIKIKYSGDLKKIVLKEGNVLIKTEISNILELAPVSYQNGDKIASNFKLENNLLSFELPNGYDVSKDLIIDPWVINLSLTSNNYGYDVDYDYAGNYYVYGGSGPFLISKYSQTGTLLWTFAGTVPSVGWTSGIDFPSNFIVDKNSGKIYTGEGFNYNTGTRIIRLNTAGIYDNFISSSVQSWHEVWDMAYNCIDGSIFGLGGGITDNNSAGILNTSNGSIVPQNFTGISGYAQDIVSHTVDPDGNFYFILTSYYGTPSINNKILKVNSTFNGNVWMLSSNYNTFDESSNKIYPNSGLSMNSSNGFNALASNNNYLYYYDGFNLAAYNKVTGVQIGSTTIPGLSAKHQGGIAVDECNNIYVGGNGAILSYNFNGTTFTSNGNIPVNSTTTNKYVTDIKLKYGSNELYVSGSGFGGIYTATYTTNCSSQINSNITQTNININNTSVTATVVTSVNNPILTYTWYNSSNTIISQTVNSSSLTNTINNLPDGVYTVLIQINAPCGPTSSQMFIVGNVTTITPIFTQVAAICSGQALQNLPTTSNNGVVGTWSPAINNTNTTTYTFTPNVGQNATTTTMTIVVNPRITPTFNINQTICQGDVISPLPNISIEGITGTWSPNLNNVSTTTYTFTPTSGVCVDVVNVTINVLPKIIPTFNLQNYLCWGEPSPQLPLISQNGISGAWNPNTVSNTLSGSYQFTPNSNECALMPPPLNISVYDDFDFVINQDCIDEKFNLSISSLNNTFDVNSSSITWFNSSNSIVGNGAVFNVTNYLNINSITPLFPLIFIAEVTLPNGCIKTHTISINKIYCAIQKGISPIGDNLNDYFDLELLNVKKLEIYNRYGVKVYSKSPYKKEWYGQTDSGKILPDGTYYYIIEFNSDKPITTGWIYLNKQN